MPERVVMSRSKGWRKPPNTVYVGRPSLWGNPFRPGDKHPRDGKPMTRSQAVGLYREAITRPGGELSRKLDPRCTLKAAAAELRGKNLACWCGLDGPCHADVLLELANR